MHRWLFVGLALMAAVGGVGTALVSGQRVQNPSLGLELIAMSRETSGGGVIIGSTDEYQVEGGFTRPSIPDREALAEMIKTAEQLVEEHTARLKEIVDEYGWPGKRLVGHDGAHAAFELLRQSDDKDFRAQAASLMQQLPKGQVDPYDLATIVDLVAMEQGRPQVYGTQIGCNRDTGQIEVAGGIEDEASLNQRRAEIGLPGYASDLPGERFRFGACEVGN